MLTINSRYGSVSFTAATSKLEKQSDPEGVGVGVGDDVLGGVDVLMWGSKVVDGKVVYAQLLTGDTVTIDSEKVDPLQTQYAV